jgi:1-deoxyxylulose-5-phosphate synthase
MDMDYVRLGSTGTKVSRLCLGCMAFGAGMDWMLNEADSIPILKAAYDAGINFYDTANMYSTGESERIVGKALREFGANRDEMVVATKVFFPMGRGQNQRGLSRKNILASIDASLSRLGMDYVDLYQIHRFDYDTPIEETLDALNEVVRSGKARYIGASSMFSWQFAQYLALADSRGLARFVTMQNHYNLAYREEEREMIPLCESEGIGLMPYSPLAGGFLVSTANAGTVRSQNPLQRDRFKRREDQAVIDALHAVAAKRGAKPAEVAIAWLLSKPNLTPIVGPSKAHHLEDPLKALAIKLDAEEIAALEEPYVTQPVMGPVRPGEVEIMLRRLRSN